MLTREQFEQRENEALAPYAARCITSLGRIYPEQECQFRSIYQHDRDRIVHSEAFRRLEYKTQVFVNHEGDYYRTRLTHTIEVAQISRGLARTLQLNEDLAEAIALAHDLGHTPFGHIGETTLDNLMADEGGFEHNYQSFRVVTSLEHRYPNFPGLNLSYEVLEGIAKHSSEYDNPEVKSFKDVGFPTIEAQIVNIADEIAYINHDLDDGLQSGMLGFEQLEVIPLWRETYDKIYSAYPDASKRVLKSRIISSLIHYFVGNAQEETLKRIKQRKITSLNEVRKNGKDLVSFSEELAVKTKELKIYLFENLYRHYRVARMADKAKRILEDLFNAYLNNPRTLPTTLYKLIQEKGQAKRYVCDYIAGMTDRFALLEHKKLFDPSEKV
ncbi:MAG: deoxyguanosinetriphosphate triphosphohydrolase [Pseudomonadota bacterium]